MAISETSLKDVALMTIDEINAKGGVLGKKVEPVVVDPASNWPLFAEKARQLLTKDKVAAVRLLDLGLPEVGAPGLRGAGAALLPRAVRRGGAEPERLLHRRRAEPAGHPAVEYLMSKRRGATRFFLLGTDYVYPRTTNKILRASSSKASTTRTSRRRTRLRPQRLPDHRRADQSVRGRRTHRGDLHHQRRLQRSFYKELGNQG